MRDEKKLLLDEIKQKIDSSSAMIITRYDRLPPNLSWDFRDQLTKSGSLFEVVRKRIFLKAAEMSGIKMINRCWVDISASYSCSKAMQWHLRRSSSSFLKTTRIYCKSSMVKSKEKNTAAPRWRCCRNCLVLMRCVLSS